MSGRYRYDHQSVRHRRFLGGAIIVLCLLVAGVVGFFQWDIRRNASKPVSSSGSISQVTGDNAQRLTIDEPNFTFDLPGDWKETGRTYVTTEHSITWQATRKNADNRYLTVYVDIIPGTKAVNRLLPLRVQEDTLISGDVSDNCSTFTGPGVINTEIARTLKETPTKWQGVNFICDLPRYIDNEVGTGSTEGVNTVTVTGSSKGAHKYFFLYTDRNNQPDYSILLDAIHSFRAK